MPTTTNNAIITGASTGLGHALARALADRGYSLTIDARHAHPLEVARRAMAATGLGRVTAVAGDVTDPEHRAALIQTAARYGPIDLLVNNASELGGSPQPTLRGLDPATFERVWRTNVDAPLQLIRACPPAPGRRSADHQRLLRCGGRALSRLGWLRGQQGRARPADPHLGGRGTGLHLVRRRSWRHADGDASGRVPWRGHLRPTRARHRRTSLARPDWLRTAERTLSGGGVRPGRADVGPG